MKKMFCLLVMLLQTLIAISYCAPMESYKNYNVVLVHGAGGRYFGLDCDDDSSIKEASKYLKPNKDATDIMQENYLELIGGYGKKLFFVDRDEDDGSADDMRQLRNWLTKVITLDSLHEGCSLC